MLRFSIKLVYQHTHIRKHCFANFTWRDYDPKACIYTANAYEKTNSLRKVIFEKYTLTSLELVVTLKIYGHECCGFIASKFYTSRSRFGSSSIQNIIAKISAQIFVPWRNHQLITFHSTPLWHHSSFLNLQNVICQ